MLFGKKEEPCEYLIVGLGNPDDEYAHTRHNAGFDTVDIVAEEAGVRYWKAECGAVTGSGVVGGARVLIAKPQSFMNTSGGPVKQLCTKYDIAPDRVIVVHDDLDIGQDSIRVKFGGGHGGHNGLRSICDKLGTRDWFRVRVGIGRPPGRMDVVDYVLSRPKGEDAEAFTFGCDRAAQAVECLVRDGLEKAQQTFN